MNDAERHQHLDVVRYLESIGARGHEMRGDPDGPATELCRAAARADLERLRELVRNKGYDVNAADYDKRTAMHLAASEGKLKVVRLLVDELKADHSPRDRWGGTPMNDATRHQHLDVVDYLRSAGAQLGSAVARDEGHRPVGSSPIRSDNGPAAELCDAAARADLERLRELVRNKGYDVNAADYDKRTAMHLAASEGKLKVVRLLVGELKADHSPRDRWGGTPMNDATRHQHLDVVDYLRSAGAQLGSAAQDAGSESTGRNKRGPWRPAHAAHEVAAAQQHLEMTIQQVHSSFAKFDADGSGLLEPAEVAAALNSLGALSGGREADASEAQRIMISHDYKNDALTADQFKDLVRVLAMEGQIELKGELQAEVDKITKAEKEDPWAVALRGDKVVRGMVDKLRLKMAGCEDMDASLAGSIASFSTDKRGRRGCLGCFTVAISCCGVIPILHPNRWFCSSWTMLMALLVVYCAVTVPLEVAFEGTSLKIALGSGGWQTWEICNVLIDVLFMVDLIVSFRTGYILEGRLVKEERDVALHYLRGSFATDLLGSLPIALIAFATAGDLEAEWRINRLVRIFKLHRLFRLVRLSSSLKPVVVLLNMNPSLLRVMNLAVVLIWLSHCIGCMWWLIADLELTLLDDVPRNSWHPPDDVYPSGSLGQQWARAFYWGAGVITTMATYDIEPITSLEVIFTAMCMFVGTIVTALIIGSMVTALSNFDSRKAIAADKLRTLDAYLQIHTVAPDLRIAVRSYCAYRYSSLQGMDDLKLFQDLPPSLAARLAIAVHQRVVARTPFLAALSDSALLAVLARLRTVVFMPGEVVIVEGQPLTEIHWVKKGEVRLLRYLDTPGEHTVRVVGQSEVPDAPSLVLRVPPSHLIVDRPPLATELWPAHLRHQQLGPPRDRHRGGKPAATRSKGDRVGSL